MTPRGNTHAPRGYTGLTPLEAAIMAEWDGTPLGMKAIARKLGIPPRRVEATISTYDGRADHALFCRQTRAASEALASAIARHHPERIAA